MKLFGLIRKLNKTKLILGLFAAILLVLPFIMTLYVLRSADRLEEKRNAYISAAAKTNDNKNSQGLVHSITTEDIIEVEPEKAETMVTEPSNLMMAMNNKASDNDAKPVVSTDTDASKDRATPSDAVKKNGKTVYLTFDDGPSKYTMELLDVLDKYDVKATFFVVVNSYKYTEELKRIVADGHTLGLHSKSHIYSKLYADYDSYVDDVNGVHDLVERITGVDTRFYRFPGGSSNDVSTVSMSKCIKYLKDNGYTYFDWNAESKDAEDLSLTPEELKDNVLHYVSNNEGNSIVLMHDLDKHYNTIEALPMIIEALREEGYELAPVDENTPPFHHREN